MKIGIHCSIRNGLISALEETKRLGCNTMQIFTRSPLTWLRREIPGSEIDEFNARRAEEGISPLVIHVPYLPNLATSSPDLFKKSLKIMEEELMLSGRLNADYVVLHPGAYSLDSTREYGIKRITSAFNTVLKGAGPGPVFLLENVSGGGRRLGSTFEELKLMLDGIRNKKNMGVCLDTAHLLGAGYDLTCSRGVENTVREFDRVIGLEKLGVIHLNDSMAPMGSGLDRHQHLGKGHIGAAGIRAIVTNRRLAEIPMILETPKGKPGDDAGNIRTALSLAKRAVNRPPLNIT